MTPSLAARLSAAAHEALPHANPLAPAQVAALLDLAGAAAPARALDVGCGPGTLALALAERAPVAVLGIDVSEPFLERARRAAAGRKLAGQVTFRRVEAHALEPDTYDLVLCVGASQAIGTPREALAWCRQRLTPRGTLLFADLHWSATPHPEFLEFLGVPPAFYWSEGEEAEAFATVGLRLEHLTRATAQAWEAYERGVHAGRLAFAAGLPPEDAAGVIARAEAWRAAFTAYGSRCLGFTAYVSTRAGA